MVPGRLCAVCSEEDLARYTPRSLNYLQTTTVLVVSQITCKGRLTQIKTVPILFIDCWVGCVPSARLRAKPHPNHLTEIPRKLKGDKTFERMIIVVVPLEPTSHWSISKSTRRIVPLDTIAFELCRCAERKLLRRKCDPR